MIPSSNAVEELALLASHVLYGRGYLMKHNPVSWDGRKVVSPVEQRRRAILVELKTCKDITRGKELHAEAIHGGHDSWIAVATALVKMYSKCGSMVDARKVFEHIKHPDVVSWTALILGYAEYGKGNTALDVFERMKSQGCRPDSVAYIGALKACISLTLKEGGGGKAECRERGMRIHLEIGYHSDTYLHSTLIDMYSKCGCMAEALKSFYNIVCPDVVAWNALIMGYAENGEGLTALNLLTRMKSEGYKPDSITFIAGLKACASLAVNLNEIEKLQYRELGKQIHLEIGSHSSTSLQNTLIDMYAKCGSMDDARYVFDSMKQPDVVSWNALISGYADNGDCNTALNMFALMKCKVCKPQTLTYVAALKACTLLGALETGRKIHAEISDGSKGNAILVTSLVDFYAKCGSMVEAQKVFDLHYQIRDHTTWNALLAGHSRLGEIEAAFRTFEAMKDAGFQPNSVTFLCILTCCNHAGLVAKACELFDGMSKIHNVIPTVEQYTCMVDILGRSNKLDAAMALLRDAPCRANAVTWKTVLSACDKWKNVGIGRLAFKSVVSLNDEIGSSYVLMAHIYGSVGMWVEQEMILGMRGGLKVEENCRDIDDSQGHTFLQPLNISK